MRARLESGRRAATARRWSGTGRAKPRVLARVFLYDEGEIASFGGKQTGKYNFDSLISTATLRNVRPRSKSRSTQPAASTKSVRQRRAGFLVVSVKFPPRLHLRPPATAAPPGVSLSILE